MASTIQITNMWEAGASVCVRYEGGHQTESRVLGIGETATFTMYDYTLNKYNYWGATEGVQCWAVCRNGGHESGDNVVINPDPVICEYVLETAESFSSVNCQPIILNS